MNFGWHDAVGTFGVALIVIAYALLQTRRLPAEAPVYSLLNAFGAAAILVSLIVDFNFSAVLMEATWLLLSIYGLWRARRPHKAAAPEDS